MHVAQESWLVPTLHVNPYLVTGLFAQTWGYKLNISSSIAFGLCCTCLTSCTRVFLRILWHSQSGRHSQNNLAKFGYILDMKVEKKNSFYIFGSLLLESNCKNWQFEKKTLSKSGKFGSFFPCIGWNHIFKETWLYGLSWIFINQDPCPSFGMFLLASRKFLVWINARGSRRIISTYITCE